MVLKQDSNGYQFQATLWKALLIIAAAVTALGGTAMIVQGVSTTQQAARSPQQGTAPQEKLISANDTFEVVSIRQSIPDRNIPVGGRGGSGGGAGCRGLPQIDPGRIVFNNHSLYTLIAHAYGLVCSDVDATGLISGGPEWARTDKWVVQATIPQDAGLQTSGIIAPMRPAIGDPRLRKMLQNLLADRFKLLIHRVTKEIPTYTLTVAKGGSKLQHPENVPCTARGDNNIVPLKSGQKPYCSLEMVSMAISDFTALIRMSLDRPVIDKTGLAGTYEFRLLYSQPNRPSDDPAGPSIFTAVEEQLGLKLESAKGPVEILVIDSVERPTEN
jgi:uncharacterized protein (TIGR03435 family)